MARSDSYHHGDLRRAVFEALTAALLEVGPAGVSLRELARRAGVSHAAPAHHFGDKRGLLTAFSADGHRLLGAALRAASDATGGDFGAIGLAYVEFALEHRAHFEVMFQPELLRRDDPELLEAAELSGAFLHAGAARETASVATGDVEAVMIGAWSLVHGFATLWLTGNIPAELGPPDALARRIMAATDVPT
jgi:AcrR family transcriptional regulator